MGINWSELAGAETGGRVVGADKEGKVERTDVGEQKGEGGGHGDG